MTAVQTKPISFEYSRKQCIGELGLNAGLKWAHYENSHEHVYYENPDQHTLSFYVQGGYMTHRTDIQSNFGSPDAYCLMPQDCRSQWQVGDPQQMMHLYFDDDYIRQLALKTFDIDPRVLTIPEQDFIQNQQLHSLCRHNLTQLDWQAKDNRLLIGQVTDTILVLMLNAIDRTKFNTKVTGGLAPSVLVKVCDYIHTYYHRQIYLSELAELAQLSEYHFCRMFKRSTSQTPQAYLTDVRIEQVKHLLTTSKSSLSDIALSCGFSNQSHMGRYFKKLLGVSPKQFRTYHRKS